MAHAEPTRVFAPFKTPLANFDVVDIRPALKIRPRRTSSLRDEHRAFSVLAAEMAATPRNMLQKLVELPSSCATLTRPGSVCWRATPFTRG